MVMRPWLDVIPTVGTADQLRRPDRAVTGEVTDILDGGVVEVQIEGSEEPLVVAPVESGVTAVGARVRLLRDSSGRVVQVSSPITLPAGAEPVGVGATGEYLEWLAATDTRLAAAQQSLVEADAERGQAMADLTEQLNAAAIDQAAAREILDDLNDVAIPALDEKLEGLGDLEGVQEQIDEAMAQLDSFGHVVTEGPPPADPVIGKTIWVAGNGVQYRAVECEEGS